MKKLTLRYSLSQFTYWAASTGATSFATAYMLGHGLPSALVGTLLAVSGLLSCISQPMIAAAMDKNKSFALPQVMLLISLLCGGCYCLLMLNTLPLRAVGLLYMLGIWSSDAMHPMLNALSVAYNSAGCRISYGPARALGSAASAISTLTLGYILADLGSGWMLAFIIFFRAMSIVVLLGYPRIEKAGVSSATGVSNCTAMEFLLRYKRFCITLLGVLFCGMFHAMTENYMIAIMGRLGGDSSHVGTALFIGSMCAAPAIFVFDRIRRYYRDSTLLKIGGLSFFAKAMLLYFAGSINTIYVLQLIQITSYVFLVPTLVYYAGAKVSEADMIKGQAFATAAYSLGCAAGNFAGGQLLGHGVESMLIAGIVMAGFGAVIVFFSAE